jgi:hypothetical protein
MTAISGTIRIGEAQATCAATAKRQRGAAWPYFVVMAGLWIGGAVIGWVLGRVLHVDVILAACAGAVIGLLSYRTVCNRLVVWRFRKRLTGTGTPLDMPARMEMTPEALTYELADIAKRGRWPAVSELFRAKGYWIFMVQSEPWFAPDHFFKSDGDKRAFLREALSHMSPEARARSRAAVKFVESSV